MFRIDREKLWEVLCWDQGEYEGIGRFDIEFLWVRREFEGLLMEISCKIPQEVKTEMKILLKDVPIATLY